MRVAVVYATLTGNTKRVAEAVFDHLACEKALFNLAELKDYSPLDPYDVIVSCYWCRKSSADDLSLRLYKGLQGRAIIAVGTVGAPVDGPYGEKVMERVQEAVALQNRYIGGFVCRGKIDPARTERRMKLPPGAPHYLGEAGYRRHMASLPHPSAEDLSNACAAVDALIAAAATK